MMKTNLILVFAALLLATQSQASTTLQISEAGAGVLTTEAGDIRTEFVVAPSYPISTVGNTTLVLTLTDDIDSSQTVLQFPVYVSAFMNNGAQNSPSFSYLKDGASAAATVTDSGAAMGAASEEANFMVADLGAGNHVITLQVEDSIARTYAVTMPLFTRFEDADGDGIANVIDDDDDGDGVLDVDDYFPLDALVSLDTDQDGIGDEIDDDDDNDGIPDIDDGEPKNVDHLALGPPMPRSNLFVLQAASVSFIDDDVSVDEVELQLASLGEGLLPVDEVEQGVFVNTTRDYDAIEFSISDSRIETQTVRMAFNAYAYRVPEPLPAALSISSDTVLTEVDDSYIETANNGLIAVYGATFASADPAPFVRLQAELSGASPISITTIGDRSIDDDGMPAFIDEDWDDDGFLNVADAFPEDASESGDADGDGVGDIADLDDDNDGTPDTEDAFPLDDTESIDTDGDLIGNNADDDDDDDGVVDADDYYPLDPTRSEREVSLVADLYGTWFVDETPGPDSAGGPVVFMFLPNGQFLMGQDGDSLSDPNGVDGLEIGTYTFDGFTLGVSSILLDTNGEWGLGDLLAGGGLEITVDANSLVITDGPTLTRVDSNSIVGGWLLDGPVDDEMIAIAFLADGRFMLLHGNNPGDDCNCGQAGIEFGDYSWNPGSGAFDYTVLTDTTGEFGLSEGGLDLIGIQNDTLTISGDDLVSLTRDGVDADTDGDGLPNSFDSDDDGDGVADVSDLWPLSALESVDTDGDGTGDNADTDDDNDGVADVDDDLPLDPTESIDTDSDGIGNNADSDDDNDGVADIDDVYPLDSTEWLNTDGDAFGNNADDDDDNDGVLDIDDAFPLDPTRSVAESNNAPVIELEGAATLTLSVGQSFSDPGALAFDDEDGDLSSSVITISDVNTAVPGTYSVEYRVTDSGGLTSTVSRSVIVIQPPSSGAVRILAGQVIELPVVGTALTAPNGSELVVPNTATAASINVTAVTPGGSGFITVWPCGVARPLASNLNYVAGDVVPNGVIAPIGSNGKVCFFSLVDTDLVVDVAGWFEGDAFVGATPLRLVDTRETARVTPAAPLVLKVADIPANTADGTATIIPANVGAVALNVTVVSPDASGFVTVYPCDVPRPLASNVNYTAGQIVPNGVIAPVSASGEVCIYSLAPTDVVVDLAGWFPGAAFTAATPQRLVDTRDGTGAPLEKLNAVTQLSVAIHGQSLSVGGNSAQVPLSATAAALNVTIVNPEGSGFATVWPCSAARPLASNLNFVAGQIVANNVIAPIGDQGNVCFYTNVPSDIIVDIAGYFSGETGNQFVGSTPKRYIDTRSNLGPAPQ